MRRYAFRSTEKAALQEIGPRFTLKLKSLRTGLPAVKEFGEPSTGLEFDEFDDLAADGGEPGGDSPGRPSAEGPVVGGEEHEEPESKSEKKTKPPTVDEYQWQWKVCHPVRVSCDSVLTRSLSLSLRPPDAHSFCSLSIPSLVLHVFPYESFARGLAPRPWDRPHR